MGLLLFPSFLLLFLLNFFFRPFLPQWQRIGLLLRFKLFACLPPKWQQGLPFLLLLFCQPPLRRFIIVFILVKHLLVKGLFTWETLFILTIGKIFWEICPFLSWPFAVTGLFLLMIRLWFQLIRGKVCCINFVLLTGGNGLLIRQNVIVEYWMVFVVDLQKVLNAFLVEGLKI